MKISRSLRYVVIQTTVVYNLYICTVSYRQPLYYCILLHVTYCKHVYILTAACVYALVLCVCMQCNPTGRSAEQSEWVDIVQDIEQMGNNPLIVFDEDV